MCKLSVVASGLALPPLSCVLLCVASRFCSRSVFNERKMYGTPIPLCFCACICFSMMVALLFRCVEPKNQLLCCAARSFIEDSGDSCELYRHVNRLLVFIIVSVGPSGYASLMHFRRA